jgi:hypothetical protein
VIASALYWITRRLVELIVARRRSAAANAAEIRVFDEVFRSEGIRISAHRCGSASCRDPA